MTWHEQVECENFLCNINKHFKEVNVINFDIIHQEVRGEKVPEDLLRHYETDQENRVSQYSLSDQKKILPSAFRTDREDMFLKRRPF